MTVRTRRREVSFRHPFRIRGVDGEQPAGAYTIETDEELLEQLSFPVWHRVATTLMLPTGSNSYAMFRIDPADLLAAEKRDAETDGPAG